MPTFVLQIVDAEKKTVIEFPGGGRLERDLIAACTDAIVAQGVGILRTEATVKKAIAAGITSVIRDLKGDTRYVVR